MRGGFESLGGADDCAIRGDVRPREGVDFAGMSRRHNTDDDVCIVQHFLNFRRWLDRTGYRASREVNGILAVFEDGLHNASFADPQPNFMFAPAMSEDNGKTGAP